MKTMRPKNINIGPRFKMQRRTAAMEEKAKSATAEALKRLGHYLKDQYMGAFDRCESARTPENLERLVEAWRVWRGK